MATGEYPIHQQQRPTLSLQCGTIPRGDHPAPWWQVDYVRRHPSRKGQQFVLTEVSAHSGYGFSFPACSASAKASIRSNSMIVDNFQGEVGLLIHVEERKSISGIQEILRMSLSITEPWN